MYKETTGTVISAKKQWWFKVNTKPARLNASDGAVFPYIIKVTYRVDAKEYTRWGWIPAGFNVPNVGSTVGIRYSADKPSKSKILL